MNIIINKHMHSLFIVTLRGHYTPSSLYGISHWLVGEILVQWWRTCPTCSYGACSGLPLSYFSSQTNLLHFQLVHSYVSQHLESNWLLYSIYIQGKALLCALAVAQFKYVLVWSCSQTSSKTFPFTRASCKSASDDWLTLLQFFWECW